MSFNNRIRKCFLINIWTLFQSMVILSYNCFRNLMQLQYYNNLTLQHNHLNNFALQHTVSAIFLIVQLSQLCSSFQKDLKNIFLAIQKGVSWSCITSQQKHKHDHAWTYMCDRALPGIQSGHSCKWKYSMTAHICHCAHMGWVYIWWLLDWICWKKKRLLYWCFW